MLRNCLFAVAVLAASCVAGAAQDKKPSGEDANTGIVYGADHSFTLSAPEGWVLDNSSGVGQGLHAVFYPKGSSWQKSSVVMYANVVRKKNETDTLESFISGDVATFKQQSPGIKIADAEAPTLKGREVRLKYFTGDQFGNHEAVAYVGERKVVVMLVLSAKAKKDFDAALPAFNQLISSYHFLSDKVVTKK